MTKADIAQRIRSARLNAGLSQHDVGSRMSPKRRRDEICRYEYNRATPNVITIEQLAAALGVSPCWLAFGCEDRHDDL